MDKIKELFDGMIAILTKFFALLKALINTEGGEDIEGLMTSLSDLVNDPLVDAVASEVIANK